MWFLNLFFLPSHQFFQFFQGILRAFSSLILKALNLRISIREIRFGLKKTTKTSLFSQGYGLKMHRTRNWVDLGALSWESSSWRWGCSSASGVRKVRDLYRLFGGRNTVLWISMVPSKAVSFPDWPQFPENLRLKSLWKLGNLCL